MKIDLTQCKTPEDVERAMKPLGELMGKVNRLLAGDETGRVDTGPVEVKSATGELTIGRLVVEVGATKPRRRAPRGKR